MRVRLQAMTLGLGLAFALTAGVAPARAAFIASVTGIATAAAGGLTLYTYTVTDSVTSTVNVGNFNLNVPSNANLTSFTMPAGYLVDYTAGNTLLSFDSLSPATDLTPGQSATFSFLSPDRPGLTTYTLLDYNTFSTVGGSVVGPGVVPEPGSLVLLGFGLPFAVAMLARRRSRKPVGSPARPA